MIASRKEIFVESLMEVDACVAHYRSTDGAWSLPVAVGGEVGSYLKSSASWGCKLSGLLFTCIARRGEHACPPCSGVLLAMHSEFGIHSTKGHPRVEDRAGRHLTGASDRGSTGIKLSGARERTRTSRAYKQETVVPDYRRRPGALI